jgi:syntaxin-binding protein 1
MTYSEIRSAYELAETFDREVYIGKIPVYSDVLSCLSFFCVLSFFFFHTGSTHIIAPEKFVHALAALDKPILPAKSVVPSYSASSLSAPPRTSSSSTSSTPSTPIPSSSSRGKLLKKW